MVFSFAVLMPVALMEPWPTHRRLLEKQWKGIVVVGVSLALNIALNNISLLDVSLTLNQIIRWAGEGAGRSWHGLLTAWRCGWMLHSLTG